MEVRSSEAQWIVLQSHSLGGSGSTLALCITGMNFQEKEIFPAAGVSHTSLRGKMLFNRTGMATETAHYGLDIHWPMRNKSAVLHSRIGQQKSQSVKQSQVRAGVWRQALGIKLSETWKIYFVCGRCWRKPWGWICLPAPKGGFPHLDCVSAWKNTTQSITIRIAFAIWSQTA